MDPKLLPSIIDYHNKEEDNMYIIDEKSTSESESESESGSHRGGLPKEIHHPSHPNHPLYLYKQQTFPESCSFCSKYITIFGYHCKSLECACKLYLDIECASLMPRIKHEEHNRFLSLIESFEEERTCRNCNCDCYGFYARCLPCDINYHVQCRQESLPRSNTVYEFHNHPLLLTYYAKKGKVCDVCDKELNLNLHPNITVYKCEQCDYSCHVGCVILEIKREKREKLDHSYHDHVMFLCDENEKKDDEVKCRVCGNSECNDETSFTYGCGPCSFYLHKSCIDKLPLRNEIAHVFHPRHPLTLCWKDCVECNACGMIFTGFTYRCVECNFDIDLDCVSKEPSIRYEHHKHLLTFFNKLNKKRECKEKCGFSSNDLVGSLRCVQCDFSVHLLCSPLPRNMKFKGHLHSLVLDDYLIEDDFGEYYCDHCEDLRDPKECVYRCAEGCPYIAEFTCVLDEVLLLMSEKHEEDGFRRVNRHAADEDFFKMVIKGLYLHEIYKSSDKEEFELKSLKSTTQMDLETIMNKEYLRIIFSLFKSDAIEQARRIWWHSPLLITDLKSEVVKIGNYIITKDLENVFSRIHHKYSDFGEKCSLSEGSKTIVVIHFVQVIHEMLQTKISNIDDEVFLSWLFRMIFVQQAGFTVDFVFKHMNKIGEVRCGIKMEIARSSFFEDNYKNIVGITNDIEVREAKLVMLRMKRERTTNLICNKTSVESRVRLRANVKLSLETVGKMLL